MGPRTSTGCDRRYNSRHRRNDDANGVNRSLVQPGLSGQSTKRVVKLIKGVSPPRGERKKRGVGRLRNVGDKKLEQILQNVSSTPPKKVKHRKIKSKNESAFLKREDEGNTDSKQAVRNGKLAVAHSKKAKRKPSDGESSFGADRRKPKNISGVASIGSTSNGKSGNSNKAVKPRRVNRSVNGNGEAQKSSRGGRKSKSDSHQMPSLGRGRTQSDVFRGGRGGMRGSLQNDMFVREGGRMYKWTRNRGANNRRERHNRIENGSNICLRKPSSHSKTDVYHEDNKKKYNGRDTPKMKDADKDKKTTVKPAGSINHIPPPPVLRSIRNNVPASYPYDKARSHHTLLNYINSLAKADNHFTRIFSDTSLNDIEAPSKSVISKNSCSWPDSGDLPGGSITEAKFMRALDPKMYELCLDSLHKHKMNRNEKMLMLALEWMDMPSWKIGHGMRGSSVKILPLCYFCGYNDHEFRKCPHKALYPPSLKN